MVAEKEEEEGVQGEEVVVVEVTEVVAAIEAERPGMAEKEEGRTTQGDDAAAVGVGVEPEVLAKEAPQVALKNHEEPKGAAAGLDLGLEATGAWLLTPGTALHK